MNSLLLPSNAIEGSKGKMREQDGRLGSRGAQHPTALLCGHKLRFPALYATSLADFKKGKSIKGGSAGDGHCLHQSSVGKNSRKRVCYLGHQAER